MAQVEKKRWEWRPGSSLLANLGETAVLRAAFSALPDAAIFAFDLDGRCVIYGGEVIAEVEWASEEVLGRRPGEILGGRTGSDLDAQVVAALEGESITAERVGFRDPNDRWIHTTMPLKGPDGAVVGALLVTREVGALRRAEDRHDRAQAAAETATEMLATERWERERVAFLAEINEVLAECVDRRGVMRAAANAAVPRLGDWCAVYALLDPDDPRPAIEIAHADPEVVAAARRYIERHPFDPESGAGVPAVLRSGRPAFYPEITDEGLAGADLPPAVAKAVRLLDLRSVIAVPMRKPRQVIGAILFGLSGAGRRYDHDDLTLAQTMAGRVASSLDNRRLAELQRDIARALQHGLLPAELPTVDSVDLAARYWAAGEGTEVGGDFYDAFAVQGDVHALVIGDVCGSGPEAASITALARHTIRAAVWLGLDHRAILSQLNESLLRSAADRFVTAALATLRPLGEGRFSLTVALGGHPSPLLVRAGGVTELLGRSGTLLGAFEQVDHHEVTTELSGGDTVIFYTDGAYDMAPPAALSLDEFVHSASVVISGSKNVDEAATRLSAVMDEHRSFAERTDDVALLLVRIENRAEPSRVPGADL